MERYAASLDAALGKARVSRNGLLEAALDAPAALAMGKVLSAFADATLARSRSEERPARELLPAAALPPLP